MTDDAAREDFFRDLDALILPALEGAGILPGFTWPPHPDTR